MDQMIMMFVKDMEKLRELNDKIGDTIAKFEAAGLVMTDEVFGELTSLDLYVHFLSELYGINEDAIFWFIYDNEFGDKQIECVHKMDEHNFAIPICNAEDFYKFERNEISLED